MNQGDMFGPSLAQAKADTMLSARTKALRCPLCTHNVKVYRRKFNSRMALTMVYTYPMFKSYPRRWLDIGNYCVKHHDFIPGDHGKLAWWGLMEHSNEAPKHGARVTSKYRMTERGFLFTENRLTVPSHAIEYLSDVESLVGDEIDIQTALGKNFNYRELMREIAGE
jgi:hypothetical protein